MPSPAQAQPTAAAGARDPALVLWLGVVTLLVVAMVIVGGLTRLTDSGLSITEWRPVTGAIPPLSETAWLAELEKYRQIPEYQLQNRGMSLDNFKVIYWWEWGHRFLGRIIGIAFFIPLVAFWFLRRLPGALKPRLLVLLGLGGLQGAIGWWMVASGLTGTMLDVSQYRLATHLGLAFLIFAGLWWTTLDVAAGRIAGVSSRPLALTGLGLVALVWVQIVLGAFVAGLDAGRIYTTWPLMDGGFMPHDYGALSPWWRDAFENRASVQFHHRLGAYLVAAACLGFAASLWRRGLARAWALALVFAVIAQTALGIWTLVSAAPLHLSALHQAGAVVLLGAAIGLARALAVQPGALAARTALSTAS